MIYEYTTIDKSEWPRGPWDDEPDKRQWLDKETGLWCTVLRIWHQGHYNGYVALPSTEAVSIDQDNLNVHGGITWLGPSHEVPSFVGWHQFRDAMFRSQPHLEKYPLGDAAQNWKVFGRFMDDWQGWILHTIQTSFFLEGTDQAASVFGFDCGHSGDLSPALVATLRRAGVDHFDKREVYRDINYVTKECESLAQQLAMEFPNGRRFDDQERGRNR